MVAENENQALIRVEGLKVYFPIIRGLFQRKVGDVKAVDGISFSIYPGETLGFVGESGCGKTTTGRAILRVYKPAGGSIFFHDQNLVDLNREQLRQTRRKMQIIFQDPYASLNQRMTVGEIVAEPLEIFGLANGSARREKVKELFDLVGLSPSFLDRYPHEFSGGQRQRVGIARALALDPEFIVCDEPIAALDVSIQAQVINLLEKLQATLGLTYLFIAHDLSMVKHISNRVAVMYLGKIVELTGRTNLYKNPLHPYTQALLSAIPIPDPAIEATRNRIFLEGDIPSPANPPSGCRFSTRCPIVQAVCRETEPNMRQVGESHEVACHFAS